MYREYSASQLYTQLQFIHSLVDIDRILDQQASDVAFSTRQVI